MKPLLKIMAILFILFVSIFLILNATGLITVEKIELWLMAAQRADPVLVAPIVALLLFFDLFISVPTFATIALGGYFLGALVGTVTGILGLLMTGFGGYGISRRYGDRLIKFLIKDPEKRTDAVETFREHGAPVILFSRAVPMLPEVSACLAGMTRMPFLKFFALWLGSCVPYVIIAAYAGSVSTFEDPRAAIYAAMGLWLCLSLVWLIRRRIHRRSKVARRD